MDGQQATIVDGDRIVTRALAPVRKFSAHRMSALVCVALVLACYIPVSLINGVLRLPTSWVLLTSLGLGATFHFMFGVHRAVGAWAWTPFRAECRAEAEQVLQALAGRPLLRWDGDAGHTGNSNDAWPTGVAWDGEFLYVLDRGMGARIPLSMVREWRWAADQAGTTGWFAVGNRMDAVLAEQQALAQDARNAARVAAGNGLFLTVRDIDRPVWQFQTSDESVLRRWAEILAQAFERQAAS